MFLVSLGSQSIGSLTNNDGDGYENVSYKAFALFLNSLRLFHRISLNSLAIFLALNFRGLYKSSGQKNGGLCSRSMS